MRPRSVQRKKQNVRGDSRIPRFPTKDFFSKQDVDGRHEADHDEMSEMRESLAVVPRTADDTPASFSVELTKKNPGGDRRGF
jgi:hypothetical protein